MNFSGVDLYNKINRLEIELHKTQNVISVTKKINRENVRSIINTADEKLKQLIDIYNKQSKKTDKNFIIKLNQCVDRLVDINSVLIVTVKHELNDLSKNISFNRFIPSINYDEYKEVNNVIKLISDNIHLHLMNMQGVFKDKLSVSLKEKLTNSILSTQILSEQSVIIDQVEDPLKLPINLECLKETNIKPYNPLFDGTYKIDEKVHINSGTGSSVERYILRKGNQMGYFAVKSPLLIYTLQGIEAQKKCNPDHLVKLYQLFGPHGTWKKKVLLEKDIKEIRTQVFSSQYGGDKIISDEEIKTLASHVGKKTSLFNVFLNRPSPTCPADFENRGEDSLINELKIASVLFGDGSDNPHVVKSYFGGNDPSYGFYIVQEYSPGKDLQAWLEKMIVFSYSQFLNFGVQLLDGLAFLASKNIVHMDIKPDNIIFMEGSSPDNFLIKIIDLGESLNLNDENSQPQVGVYVLSPEIRGNLEENKVPKKLLSPKTDCYLAGYVLLRAMGLKPSLFKAYTKREIADNISSRYSHLPDSAKRKLVTVIDGLLKADPKERLGAEEAKHIFEELIALS